MLDNAETSANNKRDYSYFDKMDTDMLKNILKLHAQESDEDSSDIQTILYIMEVVAGREKILELKDANAAWESFKRDYQPYASEKSLYDDENTEDINTAIGMNKLPFDTNLNGGLHRPKRLFRVACVAAAFVVLLFTTTIVAYAFGYDLWGGIAQWGKETFGFRTTETIEHVVDHSSNVLESDYYDDLQSTLYAHGIMEWIAPTWLPDGFVLEELKIYNESSTKLSFHTTHIREDQFILVSVSLIYEEPYSTIEKDEAEVTVYEKGGIIHYIMTNNSQCVAVWLNGNLECSISGDITNNELTQIIDSIYER